MGGRGEGEEGEVGGGGGGGGEGEGEGAFFLGKVTALGVLCCFVACMALLASFFLPFAALINMYTYT